MRPGQLFPRDWLVQYEYGETRLGVLKSGKESDVHLVRRRDARGRTCLLAEKRFKPRAQRAFRDDWIYRGVWGEGGRREQRAMKKNTRFGQEAVHARWIANEWANLVHLSDAGATVPPAVDRLEDGYTMAFIGEDGVAAPRLAEVDLDPGTARRVWRDLVDELRIIVEADRVHGDLSPYNVLWWRERAVLIDFSQTVSVLTHPAAHDLLVRDIESCAPYFTRRGVDVRVDEVLAEIGADDHRFARQMRLS